MMKIICAFILAFNLLVLSLFAQQEKMRLAILDLNPEKVDASTARMVSDLLRTELFNTGLFRVIERKEMEAILKEHELLISGCIETECAVEIGKLLSARKMLVGTVGKLGEKYFINARIVDVELGEIEFADSAKAESEGDLDIAVKEFAQKLSKRIIEKTSKKYKKIKEGDIFGKIIEVKNQSGIINIGDINSVKEKYYFSILNPNDKIETNSLTGKLTNILIGYQDVGNIEITNVKSFISEGKFNNLKTGINLLNKKIKYLGYKSMTEVGIRGNIYKLCLSIPSAQFRYLNGAEIYMKWFERGWKLDLAFELKIGSQFKANEYHHQYWEEYKKDTDSTNYHRERLTKSIYFSPVFNIGPFLRPIWYLPISWLYTGVGLNLGYYEYDYLIDYGSTETTSDISHKAGIYFTVSFLFGMYFPPIPDFPIQLNNELRFDMGPSDNGIIILSGICYRW